MYGGRSSANIEAQKRDVPRKYGLRQGNEHDVALGRCPGEDPRFEPNHNLFLVIRRTASIFIDRIDCSDKVDTCGCLAVLDRNSVYLVRSQTHFL